MKSNCTSQGQRVREREKGIQRERSTGSELEYESFIGLAASQLNVQWYGLANPVCV